MYIFILLLSLKLELMDCDYYTKNKVRAEKVKKKAFPEKKVAYKQFSHSWRLKLQTFFILRLGCYQTQVLTTTQFVEAFRLNK